MQLKDIPWHLIILIAIILFACCLGNNLYETYDNRTHSEIVHEIQDQGARHADIEGREYQHLLQTQGLNQQSLYPNPQSQPMVDPSNSNQLLVEGGGPPPFNNESNQNMYSSSFGYNRNMATPYMGPSGANSTQPNNNINYNTVQGPQGGQATKFQGPQGGQATMIQGPQGGTSVNVKGPNGQTINATPQNTIYGIPGSQIPQGDENLYILKSEIVPPVCPACPQSTACPRQKPCPPCPPCARCPEPAFECKKVPNYSSNDNRYLPKPLLNDFSAF